MKYGISRKEEQELPKFKSHEDVRDYFKEKYDENFVLVDSYKAGEGSVYLYDLILNKEAYERVKSKKSFILIIDDADPSDMVMDSQQIEIFEDGRVHVIH